MWIEHSEQKYKVLKELGRGHSGSVLLASDPQGQKVAIKCLSRQYNDAALKRFQREFVILRSLVHPNIAQPFDFGYDANLKRYFFVAEYVEGVTLNLAVDRNAGGNALDLLGQALKALDYLHRQGVYHCDLKPANVLVTSEGVLKLIDFDVASRGNVAIGGTPPFLPPELVGDIKTAPNPRTDIYSLGVTFYQCLTGSKPYPAKNIAELKRMFGTWIPKFPADLNGTLPAFWDGLIMGMLQKNPSHRFATASAVLQQVLLLTGAKKDLLSVEDIEYRLGQHGLPIGKEEIISEAKEIFRNGLEELSPTDRIWTLEGTGGAGMSYLLDELKTLSQLRNIPVVIWNQVQQNLPVAPPFTWLVDDMEKMRTASPERFGELLTKLREVFLKSEGQGIWIVLGDLPDRKLLPKDFRRWLKASSTPRRLSPWGAQEAELWLRDIFQTPEVPDFLLDKILELGRGRPKVFREHLGRFLERGVLLDRRGNWRKDLFHPTPLFIEEFRADTGMEEFASRLAKLTDLERDILGQLAHMHGPVGGEFFETLFASKDVYPALSRLTALRLVRGEGLENLQIAENSFKNFLLESVPPDRQKAAHDTLLAREDALAWLENSEIHFHMARGSDASASARGWAFFGEECARRGLWESAFEYYSNAFDIVPASAVEKKFEYSVARGRCLIQRNLLKDAQQFFRSLLVEFADQRGGRPEIFAKIFERLGVIETKLGNADKARDHFYQGLTCLDPGYEPLEQYLAIRNFLAGLDLQQGHFEAAIDEFRETYEAAQRKLPPERRRILTNNDLGAALLKAGHFQEAVSHWEELVSDLKTREDKNPLARCYFQMGQAFFNRGDARKAEHYLTLAQESAKDLQNFELSLRIDNSLANLYRGKDDERALAMYEKALDAVFHTADPYSTAVVLLNMGFLLESQGQYARAKHYLVQSLGYLTEADLPAEKAIPLFHAAYLTLARCSAEILQAREALEYAAHAARLAESLPELKTARFETALVSWLAETLNGRAEEAALREAYLKRSARTPETKKLWEEYRERAAVLLPQLARARGRPGENPAAAKVDSPPSRLLKTRTTPYLPLHSKQD